MNKEEGLEKVDLNKFTFSRNSFMRAADKNRKNTAEDIFNKFLLNKPEDSVLHWDGKLVDNFFGTKDEKLAILVSGRPDYIEGKLLFIPSLWNADGDPTSTGHAQVDACWEQIQKYELKENIVAMTYDITSSITGCHKGAIKLIEDKLGRPVLHFGCR